MRSTPKIISSAYPEELKYPPNNQDHSNHIIYLVMRGHTKLAADHILHKEMIGHLEETIGNVIRQLDLEFNKCLLINKDEKSIIICARIYDTLLNIALNLIGSEKKIIGFSDDEVENTLNKLTETMNILENLERSSVYNKTVGEAIIAKTVVDIALSEMKKVMQVYYRPPGSLVANFAKNIEKGIIGDNVLVSFLNLAKQQIRNNIYYIISEAEMCRFGNDYALGLRWLRHLGFVQVSTNPSLAAIAYLDDSTLWFGYKDENLCPDFKTVINEHPELFEDVERQGEVITSYATEVCIWPNLAVFRPIAIASNFLHGMVSLQLNPNIANSFKDSIKDALKFYIDAKKFLQKYDSYLLWGYSKNIERGRPNIVFKVAGSSSPSIEITEKLESLGIGTNNTVTFTVAQEFELILAKIEGRIKAIKKGLHLTTVYETNMGGRLDDHIREIQAESLIKRAHEKIDDKGKALNELAEKLEALEAIKQYSSIEEKIREISSRKFLRPLNKLPLINFLVKSGKPFNSKKKIQKYLETLENDIEYCGILVTKRVYELFFDPKNKPKWIDFLKNKYSITQEEAEDVINGIHILPASKRKPKETLLTLAGKNMTHTEFPNHQLTVSIVNLNSAIKIKEYQDSILTEVRSEIIHRLTHKWADIKNLFKRSYELTQYQQSLLKDIKIFGSQRYGTRGLEASEWKTFGATEKTMVEFSKSYEKFKMQCIKKVREFRKDSIRKN
jgi:hypothetical protein